MSINESRSRNCVLSLGAGAIVILAACTVVGEAVKDSPAGGAGLGQSGIAVESPTFSAASTACIKVAAGWDNAVVLTAYESTAGIVAGWDETSKGTRNSAAVESSFRTLPPDQTVSVCYLGGVFPAPGGPPPLDGTPQPPYSRALVLLTEGGEPLPPMIFGRDDTLSVADGPPPASQPTQN